MVEIAQVIHEPDRGLVGHDDVGPAVDGARPAPGREHVEVAVRIERMEHVVLAAEHPSQPDCRPHLRRDRAHPRPIAPCNTATRRHDRYQHNGSHASLDSTAAAHQLWTVHLLGTRVAVQARHDLLRRQSADLDQLIT